MKPTRVLVHLLLWSAVGFATTVAIAWAATLWSPDGWMNQGELLPDAPWPWPGRRHVEPDPMEPIALISGFGLDQRRGAALWRDAPAAPRAPAALGVPDASDGSDGSNTVATTAAIFPGGAFAGLPFRALCSQTYWGTWSRESFKPPPPVEVARDDWTWAGIPTYSVPNDWRALPLRPLWPGLLADTALWGGLAAATWFLVGATRRRHRRVRGRCERCGHSLGGCSRCPECGAQAQGDRSVGDVDKAEAQRRVSRSRPSADSGRLNAGPVASLAARPGGRRGPPRTRSPLAHRAMQRLGGRSERRSDCRRRWFHPPRCAGGRSGWRARPRLR